MRAFIQDVTLVDSLRSQMTFSDPTKIRMYPDPSRPGIRLRGTWDKWQQKMIFPLDTDLTVRLPMWNPQAIKQWRVFEGPNVTPTGTSIKYRVNDGTQDLWWNGGAWAVPGASDWNTEAEVSDNLSSFPITNRKIQLLVNLVTTDEYQTPILYGYRFLIDALYDPWEDLTESVVLELASRLTYEKDFSALKSVTGTTFNILTDDEFKTEEIINIQDVIHVWDHDSDPGHDTDILDNYNSGTGEVTLTTSISAGTRLYYQMQVAPEIKVNYTSPDWTEVGAVPAVVIDTLTTDTRETRSILEIIDKSQKKGYRLKDSIYHREIVLGGVLLSGFTSDQMRLHTALKAGIWSNPLIYSKALDVSWSFTVRTPFRWNPRPSLSELKQSTFEAVISHVHFWLENLEELPIIENFNYTLVRQPETGPSVQKIQPVTAGDIPSLRKPELPELP